MLRLLTATLATLWAGSASASVSYEFPSGAQGWAGTSCATTNTAVPGELTVVVACPGGGAASPSVSIGIASLRFLEVIASSLTNEVVEAVLTVDGQDHVLRLGELPGDAIARRFTLDLAAAGLTTGTLTAITLRLPDAVGTVMTLQRVALLRVPTRAAWAFEDAGDALGWTANANVTGLTVTDGALSGVVQAVDATPPRLEGPVGVWLDPRAQRTLRVRVRATAPTSAATFRVYWGTSDAPTLNTSRSLAVSYTADGSTQTLSFDLYRHAKWRGTVTKLWLQPFLATEAGATFTVEHIGFPLTATFDAPGENDGFLGGLGVGGLRTAQGGLRGLAGGTPAALQTPLDVPADVWPYGVVVAALAPSADCTLGLALVPAGGVAAALTVPATCDAQPHAYVFALGALGLGAARLEALRVTTPAGAAFVIDRVGLLPEGHSYELAEVAVPDPVRVGQPLLVRARVTNLGAEAGPATLGKVVIGGKLLFLPELGPFDTAEVEESIATASSCSDPAKQQITVAGQFPGPWTWNETVAIRWMDPRPVLPSEVPPDGYLPSGLTTDDFALVQNSRIRVAFLRDTCLGGFGELRVYAADGGAWHPVGGSIGLGRVVWANGGVVTEHAITAVLPGPIVSGADDLTLPLSASWTDAGGAVWTVEWTLVAKQDVPWVEITATARATQARDLLLFSGPGLDVGLDVPGASALEGGAVGGLELLGFGDVPGTSWAVVSGDHRRRSAEPALVTRPLAALSTAGMTGGLVWEPLSAWATSYQMPQVRVDGHRVELRAPTVPQSVLPDQDLASTPFPLAANETLTLRASLVALPSAGAQPALEAALQLSPFPAPASLNTATTLASLTNALATSAWTADQGWTVSAGQTPAPWADVLAVARALAQSQGHAGLTGVATAAAALLDGPAWFTGTGRWQTVAAPWKEAQVLPALSDAIKAVTTALQAGPAVVAPAWLDYQGLANVAGAPRLAWRALELAWRAGRDELVAPALGLLVLAQIAEVPRGGLLQDGMPAAAPDVAYATDAIMAFLAARRATSDPTYLDEAIRWATLATAFIYSYDVPGTTTDRVRFGVVEAFGAADFTDSRFGRVSALEGARLANALLTLVPLDPSHGWEGIARGLAALVARRLEADGRVAARWSVREDRSEGPLELPYLLARALLLLGGVDPELRTVRIDTPAGGTVTLTSAGPVSGVAFDTGAWAVVATASPPGVGGRAVITAANLPAKPDSVTVGGTSYPEVPSVADAPFGWMFDDDLGLLVVATAALTDAVQIVVPFPVPDADNDSWPATLDCDDDNPEIHPGRDDPCNGIDDDCDGQTDEPEDTGTIECGLGACAHAAPACVLGGPGTCDPLEGATPEICDEIDCDGETDEQSDGGTIVCGLGECAHTIYACGPCDAFKGALPEVCDKVDNDCDGETDETIGTVFCGTGACEHLISVCAVCEPLIGASEEVCNLIDDDCDGETDEGLPTVPCGVGQCLHDIPSCAPCDAKKGATPEVCDHLDNDCDGQTDEDVPTIVCGTGICARPIPSCHTCDPMVGAAPEVCDGKDDDCNGLTDDAPDVKPCGTGQCYREIPLCDTCVPTVGASDEICDLVDNDCDGQTDEITGTAVCGVGICQHEVQGCAACDPKAGALVEVCNGVDDDCDGKTDEVEDVGTIVCGTGQCQVELSSCTGGAPTECDPFVGAEDEICDGVDNDCDGLTDEDIASWTCGIGACAHELIGCILTGPGSCDPMEGVADEICDGLDNDCDGETDEDQGTITCGTEGICPPVVVPACLNGKPLQCQPITGFAPELCNG